MMLDEQTHFERYIEAVPKAELHVHLEGSIQPATLLKLAQQNNVELPAKQLKIYKTGLHSAILTISSRFTLKFQGA